MKNFKNFILGVSLLAIMSGCKTIDIQNGEIPAEYASVAQTLVGEYPGTFNFRDGKLILSLEGNKPLVTFKSNKGDTDLLADKCQSKIGALTQIKVSGSPEDRTVEITGATFAFDPGLCGIDGRTLEFSISKNDKGGLDLDASLLAGVETRTRLVCYPFGNFRRGGRFERSIGFGNGNCFPEQETFYSYLNGTFSRTL